MPASPLQWFYAVLAVIGLAATWYFNLLFAVQGGNLLDFMALGYVNPAASSLTNDLVVGTVAFLTWSFVEARRLGMRRWWAYVLLTFAIAFAVAFPVFLYVRERHLQAG